MKNVEVCVTPELVHLYGVENKIVVVVDILRATSCMTTALAHGVISVTPVATLEECKALKDRGYLAAAERDGKTAEGFDLGNSPFTYMDRDLLKGKKLATTTTNGTLAITKSVKADEVVIGSFLNISSVASYLIQQEKDVLIHCAGWKGKLNLEDTLFAGALIDLLKDHFDFENDSAMAAHCLYQCGRHDMFDFLKNSSHAKRLNRLNIYKDIQFCLSRDVYQVVPVLRNGELVDLEPAALEASAGA
ncbi:MAG: 2-phosphosulfolactate phosphatase [Cytophagaceae bacterium]|jgi:2-phosphosulfolactate phosphatase|nr:2-phosphosulfolactate phosphatase [Cytophagaceae bacterium]